MSSSTPHLIERVRQIIREDRRTIDEVSMVVGISHGTCHKMLTEDLKMRLVASKFVPKFLRRLRPGNQNSIQSMEKSGVTSTEKAKASEKQHHVNVDLFL